MRWLLLIALFFCGGCIPIVTDVTQIVDDNRRARMVWIDELGGPPEYAIEYRRVVGFPMAYSLGDGVLTFLGPPFLDPEHVVRYEGPKAIAQLRAKNLPWPLNWLVWLEALLHGPFTEIESWRSLLFPRDVRSQES